MKGATTPLPLYAFIALTEESTLYLRRNIQISSFKRGSMLCRCFYIHFVLLGGGDRIYFVLMFVMYRSKYSRKMS